MRNDSTIGQQAFEVAERKRFFNVLSRITGVHGVEQRTVQVPRVCLEYTFMHN